MRLDSFYNELSLIIKHYPAREQAPEISATRLKRGADINVRTDKNRMPLYVVIGKSYPGLAHYLIEHGADIHTKDDEGWLFLHLAVSRNLPGIVDVLLERGVNINVCTSDNETPLHTAIKNNHAAFGKVSNKTRSRYLRQRQ